jgi:hypothetical protein
MSENDPSRRECNVRTKRLDYRVTGESQDHSYTYKTRLCAHQPVPWKRTNVERGAEESFFPDGQPQTYSRETLERHSGRKTMRHHWHVMAAS